jgi:hypothetical protein
LGQNSRTPDETSHGYGYTWGRVTDKPRCGGPDKCDECANDAASRPVWGVLALEAVIRACDERLAALGDPPSHHLRMAIRDLKQKP